MEIQVQYNKYASTVWTDVNFFTFSGGEVHIELPPHGNQHYVTRVKIIARITNSDRLIELLMVTDALRRKFGSGVPLYVTIPYLPYARQDKISAPGEALSLKVFADIINSQNYRSVTCFDAHSDISCVLINNLENITQDTIINYITQNKSISDMLVGKVLVSPDHGAMKKVYKLTPYLKPTKIIQADKARDQTGKIIRTEVYTKNYDELYGSDVVIVDDICDGGRTFIELAKVLKQKGAATVTLFVTHGIFSKGLHCIYEAGVDNIITTDTFFMEYPSEIYVSKIVDNLY